MRRRDFLCKSLALGTVAVTPLDLMGNVLSPTFPNQSQRMRLSIGKVECFFRFCRPGTFVMGSPKTEMYRGEAETQHEVTLSQGFWIAEITVTQNLWKYVIGTNPSHFKGETLPVETVSWHDCQDFIDKLNKAAKAPNGYRFSLPTESQWEYACRAGTNTPFNVGDYLNENQANCDNGDSAAVSNYLAQTEKVASYPANAWGLYDMHGNVWEWCQDDFWHYPSGKSIDPIGSALDSCKVCRGGSWYDIAAYCRSASRYDFHSSVRNNQLGLRLVLIENEQF